MKKSQIAAALALTYVAGATLPLATVANAAGGVVSRDCTAAVAAASAKYTGAEISALINRISNLDDYKKYQALADIKVEYDGQKYDDNATKASEAKSAADDAVNTAKDGPAKTALEKVDGVGAALNTRLQTSKFDTTKALTNVATIINAIRTELSGYAEFKALYTVVNASGKTVDAIKSAAAAFDAKVADNADINISTSTETDPAALANTVKSKTGYTEFVKYYELDLVMPAYEKAVADQKTAEAKSNEANKEQAAQVKRILDAVDALETPAVDRTSITKVEDALKKIGGNSTKFKTMDELNTALKDLSKLVKAESSDSNNQIHAQIVKALQTASIANTDALLNPKDTYTLACTNYGVTVTSNKEMPLEGLNVIVKKAENINSNLFKNKVQAVYDITLSYRGVDTYAANPVSGTDYTVTLAVPSNMNGATAEVYYVNGSNLSKVSNAKYANGKITFTTDHFSTYALVGDAGSSTNGGSTGGNGGSTGGQSTTTKTTAKAPNTGLVSDVTSGLTTNVASIIRKNDNGATNEHTVATISIVAAACATFATLVAAVRRFAKRRA